MAYHFEVDRKIDKNLTTAQQGRDLFIYVYEDLANHSVIDLDFINCDEISYEFFYGFIMASKESIKLPIKLLQDTVIFSGLSYKNIKNLHTAFLSAENLKDTQAAINDTLSQIKEKLSQIGKR